MFNSIQSLCTHENRNCLKMQHETTTTGAVTSAKVQHNKQNIWWCTEYFVNYKWALSEEKINNFSIHYVSRTTTILSCLAEFVFWTAYPALFAFKLDRALDSICANRVEKAFIRIICQLPINCNTFEIIGFWIIWSFFLHLFWNAINEMNGRERKRKSIWIVHWMLDLSL